MYTNIYTHIRIIYISVYKCIFIHSFSIYIFFIRIYIYIYIYANSHINIDMDTRVSGIATRTMHQSTTPSLSLTI